MSTQPMRPKSACPQCGFPLSRTPSDDGPCAVCGAAPGPGTAAPTLRLSGRGRLLETVAGAVAILSVFSFGVLFVLPRTGPGSPVPSSLTNRATAGAGQVAPLSVAQVREAPRPINAPVAAATASPSPPPTTSVLGPTVALTATTEPIPSGPSEAIAAPTASPAIHEVVQVGNTQGEGVYLRRTPRRTDRLSAYPEGTELQVLGPDVDGDGLRWRYVAMPDGQEGYVPIEYTVPLGSPIAVRPTPTSASAKPAAATTVESVITGLDAEATVATFRRSGSDCAVQRGVTQVSWLCAKNIDGGRVQFGLMLMGFSAQRLTQVSAFVTQESRPSDEIAANYLSLVASMAYAGAEPNRARAWVVSQVPLVDTGRPKRLTIGSALLEVVGPPGSRYLLMFPAGTRRAGGP